MFAVSDGDLFVSVDTDLPDRTELHVSVDRSYYEVGNEPEYSRSYFDATSALSQWRNGRRIPRDDAAWKNDLIQFQAKMSRISADMAFAVASASDDIEVRVAVYGKKDIIREEVVRLPFGVPSPMGESRQVAFNGLEAGSTYRIL